MSPAEIESVTGDTPNEERRERRASDPSVCLICGIQLEADRQYDIFCSRRCARKARDAGDGLDKYRRMRKTARLAAQTRNGIADPEDR